MAENGFDFDARIQRLTERQEALAQSIELLTLDVRDLQGTVRVIADSMTTLMDGVRELARTAESHERRLHRLEGGEEGIQP